VTDETPAGPGLKEGTSSARRLPRALANASERARLAREVRDVDFPVALRGYDRDAVDRYVEQVNRVIAELEVSSSPESAVRHALEEVTEETRGLLERAHETAEEITARSRSRAEDRVQQGAREGEEIRAQAAREADEMREAAGREAQELRQRAEREAAELRQTAERLTQELRDTTARETHELTETAARESEHMRATAEREVREMRARAEARVQELDRSARRIWSARRRLIESLGAVVEELQGIAETEAARFPEQPAAPAADRTVPPREPAEQPPPAPDSPLP
jgi:DivIVA domain-containing protein